MTLITNQELIMGITWLGMEDTTHQQIITSQPLMDEANKALQGVNLGMGENGANAARGLAHYALIHSQGDPEKALELIKTLERLPDANVNVPKNYADMDSSEKLDVLGKIAQQQLSRTQYPDVSAIYHPGHDDPAADHLSSTLDLAQGNIGYNGPDMTRTFTNAVNNAAIGPAPALNPTAPSLTQQKISLS